MIGLLAEPVVGLIDPDDLLGDLLFPFVSLLVSVIVFEGGLNLRVSEVRVAQKGVQRLISVGVPLTWILTSLAAYFLLKLEVQL